MAEVDHYADYGAWVWRANAESRFNWWVARDCLDTDVMGYLRRRHMIKEPIEWSSQRPHGTINIVARQATIHHAVIGDDDVQIALHGIMSTVRFFLAYQGGPEVEIADMSTFHEYPKHQVEYRFFGLFPEHSHVVAHYIGPSEQYLVACGWGLGDLIAWKSHTGNIIQSGGLPPWHGTLPTQEQCLTICRKHFGV